MPISFNIIAVDHYETPNLKACKAIIDDQRLTATVKIDARQAMVLSRGRLNFKSGGFVILADDNQVLFDYFDLTKWIQEKGLRLI